MNNKEFFSLIPNFVLIPTKEDKNTIYKIVNNDKVLLIFDYLYMRTDRIGTTLFSIGDIIETYGLTQRKGRDGVNNQIRDILRALIELKYIKLLNEINIETVNKNTFVKCKLNINYKNNFFILKNSELKTILNIDNTYDKIKLLKLYCIIKARVYTRKGGNNGINIHNTDKTGICYPSYKKIQSEIDISEGTINKYIQKLKELNLIDYANAGVCYHKVSKIKKETPNIYVLYTKDKLHEDELYASIKYYKRSMIEKGYVFVDDEEGYKNNVRKINGELGGLTRLKNEGLATPEQLKRIEQINKMNISL